MQRYRFGPDAAWRITDYGSSFRLARLHRGVDGEVRVDVAYLAPREWVGVHPAGLPQLFCVVAGEGVVHGEDGDDQPISAGEAVFWERGERHGVRTEVGLTAVIVQAMALEPEAFLTSPVR